MALLSRVFIMIGVWAVCLGGLDAIDLDPYSVLLNALICPFSKSLNLNVSEVEVYIYDFKNNINTTYKLDEAAAALHNDSNFESNRTMLIWIPGFNNTMDNQEEVRQNLKTYPNSYLMIIYHYMYTNAPANLVAYLAYYVSRAPYFYDIGLAVARFIVALISIGVSLLKILVMGHSLGAHIGGAAGVGFNSMTGNKLPRVSGIDPAGRCFSNANIQYQLNMDRADYVDITHTNAGKLGTIKNLGHANYYANDGTSQPGCPSASFLDVFQSSAAASCSHETGPYIYTAPALYSGIWNATACNSYDNYINGICDGNVTSIAGINSDPSSRGIFYFKTVGYDVRAYA